MNVIRNISVFVAGIILLLHTLLPHEHHSELNEKEHFEQHESASSLLDFIKLAFHMDQGDGHLEKYRTSKYFNFFLDAFIIEEVLPTFHPRILAEDIFSFPVSPEGPSTWLLPSQIRFRGPPA